MTPAVQPTDSAAPPGMIPAPAHPLRAIAQPGIDAIRKLWLPFLVIQACGLIVVVAYFYVEPFKRFCEMLARVKQAGGYPFAALAMGVASGVAPEVFKYITGVDRSLDNKRLRNLTFNFLLFCVAGLPVDKFYRWLPEVFGSNNTPLVVAKKVAVDQFVYSPLVGLAIVAVAYTWREHRYRIGPTLRSFGVAWYISRVATLLLPCWAYWMPMTTLMYSLPSTLTFVFGVPASAAAATVLIAVAERKVVREQSALPPA
ncbi:hypothetical protein BH10PLA1_BH10PLA1_09110 [soil metagenome]